MKDSNVYWRFIGVPLITVLLIVTVNAALYVDKKQWALASLLWPPRSFWITCFVVACVCAELLKRRFDRER
jgi:hypothetical protein